MTSALGGIQTYARELIDGMRDNGNDVRVCVCDPEQLLASLRLLDRVPWPYTWQRFYHWRRFPLQDYRFHNAIRRLLREEVREFRPDIVHCLHVYFGAAVLDGLIPSVITTYGLEVDNSPPIQRAFTAVHAIHSISHFTAELVRKVSPASLGKVSVIPWGVREPLLERSSRKTYDLVTVGRLVTRKNLDTVLLALEEMPEVRYAIAGDGPELEPLKALALAKRLKKVTFMGSIAEEKKWQLLLECSLFIMCPRQDEHDVEGLGLVYYEAHRCGLPVIAARAGGVPDAVGDAGILVTNSVDVREVRSAIRKALDPETYDGLKERVRVRQQECSWGRFINSFQELYYRVASSSKIARVQ